jgi:hypothetical protein
MMKLVYLLSFAILVLRPSEAQDRSVGVPVLGFAFDSTQGAIRPLRGIPGAAILGDRLDIGFRLTAASVAPQQNFALAIAAGEQQVRIVSWSDGKVTLLPLDDTVMAAPDRMVFSPSGTAAILVSDQRPGRVQTLKGLPGQPTVEEISLGGLTGPAGNVAVSDDGKLVIVGDVGKNSGLVWLFTPEGEQIMPPLPGAGTVFSFRRNSHEAAAMTNVGDLYLVQNLNDVPVLRSVSLSGDRTAGVVGLWLSDEGTHVHGAFSGGTVADFDLRTGATQRVACQCVPVGIQPLRPGFFRLTDISNRPVMVFDASPAAPRVWFIPLDRMQMEIVGGGQ